MTVVFSFTENYALITIEQALARNRVCSKFGSRKITTMFFIFEEAIETTFYKET